MELMSLRQGLNTNSSHKSINHILIKFNKDIIDITEIEENIIYNKIDIYLINTLIEFNNYYLIKKLIN